MFKKIVLVCVCLVIVLLSGCDMFGGNGATEQQPPTVPPFTPPTIETLPTPATPAVSPIVGTWHLNADMDIGYGLFNYDIIVTYNLNGTGRETYTSGEWQMVIDFTWTSANGVGTSVLTEGGITITSTFTYGVVGDVLTLHQDGVTLVFQRFQ